MADVVYVLCAIVSIVCASMLLRGYRRSRTRLLFWSSLCFAGLALNNILTVIDLMVIPQIDLASLRSGVALVSIGALIYGLTWDGR
jgi:predicted membrane channel-forming protein YqfA (hemolysin III family)